MTRKQVHGFLPAIFHVHLVNYISNRYEFLLTGIGYKLKFGIRGPSQYKDAVLPVYEFHIKGIWRTRGSIISILEISYLKRGSLYWNAAQVLIICTDTCKCVTLNKFRRVINRNRVSLVCVNIPEGHNGHSAQWYTAVSRKYSHWFTAVVF